jgi:tetratricopeptide (TPR) repeat protein
VKSQASETVMANDLKTQESIQEDVKPDNLAILQEPDTVEAASIIFRSYGARSITFLTGYASDAPGRDNAYRISPNDCYAAMDMAVRKMARVALHKYHSEYLPDGIPFEKALKRIFPDPVAYLAKAIRSVIADAERLNRKEIKTISLSTPLGRDDGGKTLHLDDVLFEEDPSKLPERNLLDSEDSHAFHFAMKKALASIPSHYLQAIRRDMEREKSRQEGVKLSPETDRERQMVCRARAALVNILRSECGEDNPYVMMLSKQRSGRVRHSAKTGGWSGVREETLIRKLLQSDWSRRAPTDSGDEVDEAVVNEVTNPSNLAPPSPDMRQAMRVLDVYTVSYPTPATDVARDLYDRARNARKSGRLEEAYQLYMDCYEAEPEFIEALNNAGNVLSQMGRLREALKIFMDIIEMNPPGDHKYIAATNAADIHLTWYDSGRNRERNIEKAIELATLAMRKPTPMRACNLVLAYVKDRYYYEAKKVLQTTLSANTAECDAKKFLQTLFQIRDKDLIAWWNWLEEELNKE